MLDRRPIRAWGLAATVVACTFAAACTDFKQATPGTNPANSSPGSTAPAGNPTPSSTSSTTATTAAPSSTAKPSEKGLTELEIALDLVKQVYPAGSKAQTDCLADRLQRQPELIEPAKKPLDQIDLGPRKKVIGALADCIGPDLLMVIYETKHPIDPKRRDCALRLLAIDRPLQEGVDIVAGEPGAAEKFEEQLAATCKQTGTSASSTTTAKP